jgi:hypothetical protein
MPFGPARKLRLTTFRALMMASAVDSPRTRAFAAARAPASAAFWRKRRSL